MYTSVEEIGARIKAEFGLDLDEYFIRQFALDAINQMGLLQTEDILIRGVIKDYNLVFPPAIGPVVRINWCVKADPNPITDVTVSVQNIWFPPQVVFTPVPNSEAQVALLPDDAPVNVIPHIKGPYIPFVWKSPFLKFNETERAVIAYAERIKLDPETKLPAIPEDALEACAYNCVEVYYRPMFILGKIAPGVFQQIEKWTGNRFNQCQNRIGFKQLDQNRMNDVMNVTVSMDRKAYGIDA